LKAARRLALAVSIPWAMAAACATANVIGDWSKVAADTINATGYPATTPEELRSNTAVDMATVNVAVFDAVDAIDHRFVAYAVTPAAPTTGASMESATGAATCRVLAKLFPSRASIYSAACAGFLPSSTGSAAHVKGIAVGVEVADKIVALRANDGRSTVASYTPTGLPGNFAAPPGTTPVGTFVPFIKPFAMSSAAQFRAYGPPDLTSARYAQDFNESKAVGGTVSTVRTADQEELARFATENPGIYAARNIRRFADDTRSLLDNARLQAMLWLGEADASIACFDSKYYFASWRPRTAIPAADTDGNAATVADPNWTPFLPTPNHPEYPAGHTCADGALAETLRLYYRTKHVEFDVDSLATGTTRHYDDTDAYVRDIELARIYGGMHFRTATEHGSMMGKQIAKWIARNYLRPLKDRVWLDDDGHDHQGD
jgi:hypothetical protein